MHRLVWYLCVDDDVGLKSRLFKIMIKVGQVVQPGTPLMILEAMKMEHVIKAPFQATVNKINFHVGDIVSENKVVIELSDPVSSSA